MIAFTGAVAEPWILNNEDIVYITIAPYFFENIE